MVDGKNVKLNLFGRGSDERDFTADVFLHCMSISLPLLVSQNLIKFVSQKVLPNNQKKSAKILLYSLWVGVVEKLAAALNGTGLCSSHTINKIAIRPTKYC